MFYVLLNSNNPYTHLMKYRSKDMIEDMIEGKCQYVQKNFKRRKI